MSTVTKSTETKKTIILYSTLGCHLCELAKEQLDPLLEPYSLMMKEVDIADDEQLMEKYGVRIPVVKLQDRDNELAWPFDTNDISRYLTS